MSRTLSVRVVARSKDQIKAAAKQIRAMLKIRVPKIDMEMLMESFINKGWIEVCEQDDPRLTGKYALTYPDKDLILISEETYDAAVDGNGRARFTIAHEIGHFFLHRGQMSFARSSQGRHEIYEDAEWQADAFASYFLIDDSYLPKRPFLNTPAYISETFGTSYQAAEIYVKKNRM